MLWSRESLQDIGTEGQPQATEPHCTHAVCKQAVSCQLQYCYAPIALCAVLLLTERTGLGADLP